MPVELISANQAAALSATLAGRANRTGRGFCSGVYPITPATECMEYLCAQEIEKSRVVRVESEHSAMGVCIGGAATGARTFTTTSSNGLAYMAENCITAASLRLPVVMVVANRTMGPPWNIWADHGDSLMMRDSGWIQFYCADNQEVFDTVLCAFRLAEDPQVLTPFMICMDGFTLSHTIAQTKVPEQKEVDRFLPPTSIPHQLGRIPHALGQIELSSQVAAHRAQHHNALLGAEKVYKTVQDSFEQIFNRRPAEPVVAYRLEDAETVIISMGTIGATAEQAVDKLRQQGVKAGSLRVRMFRPFPADRLRSLLRGKMFVAVIDRDISLGFGGILWGELRGLAEPGAVVQNYIAGIGGGDVRPGHIRDIVAELKHRSVSAAPVIMEELL
ncbi:MAG: pyruvate ferredoxin oxidoreductase [Deltaproteobacteria bacterium]|nr:pyruvate ferredoxin oxidoreductase [Deltaproteobacteria bacterium]